jgi:hypothetical protein
MRKSKHENEDTYDKDRPPDEFCDWWQPYGIDEPSGASIGGHPEAARMWARKDPGRWTRRAYGSSARLAWQCDRYRQEFYRWKDAGKPGSEPFVSISATLKEQAEFYDGLKGTLNQIGKPIPAANPLDSEGERFPGDAIDF